MSLKIYIFQLTKMALTNILVSNFFSEINTRYWKLTQARLEPNVASNHYATTLTEMQYHSMSLTNNFCLYQLNVAQTLPK